MTGTWLTAATSMPAGGDGLPSSLSLSRTCSMAALVAPAFAAASAVRSWPTSSRGPPTRRGHMGLLNEN